MRSARAASPSCIAAEASVYLSVPQLFLTFHFTVDTEKATGKDYAVKVIDLRPLRLRERFNPARLRREVDIIRRLHHPHIIQFIAVFETADQ